MSITFTREEMVAMLAEAGGDPVAKVAAMFDNAPELYTAKFLKFVAIVAQASVRKYADSVACDRPPMRPTCGDPHCIFCGRHSWPVI